MKLVELFHDKIKQPEDVLLENMKKASSLEEAILETSLVTGKTVEELVNLIQEVAPPCPEAEKFIKKAKKDFKKRYGKDWERVLYATAWKIFGDRKECKF